MEIKKTWEEYTKDEQTTLLNHWVYYYGGILMTLQDFSDFRILSSTRQDEIFNHIVTILLFKNTIQSSLLVTCMREGSINDLFAHSLKREDLTEETKPIYDSARKFLSAELINTFINPAPPVPMDIIKDVEDGPKR